MKHNTISAENYLRIKQRNSLRHPRYGFDLEDVIDDGPVQHAVVEAVLTHSEYASEVDKIPSRGLNRHANLYHIARSLHDDVTRLLQPSFPDLLSNVVIGLIPTGIVNACVFRDDGRGHALDKYLVAINHGLYFASSRLCDALTLEILEGDLAPFADSGETSFEDAITRYLTPTNDVIQRTHFEHSWPNEVYGEFRVRSGALLAIMLQFVTLHEIAHIVHGDVDSPNGIKRFSTNVDGPDFGGKDVIQFNREVGNAADNWPCEYSADEFAIHWLCDWKSGIPSCWSNLAQVYLFFGWLSKIEELIGRPICPYHPPALDRQKAVMETARMIATSIPPDHYFTFIDDRIHAWKSKFNS